jgi:amidohydrolase
MTDLSREVAAIEPDLIALRRDLHRRPELAFQEYTTTAVVADRLRALGLTPRPVIGRTGVWADLAGGGAGPRLLLRADIDALPLQEVGGRPYGSVVPGVMHACGHDAHTAALVGAATLIAARVHRLRGSVRFLFQPAEETLLGARAAIDAGALNGVDAAVAAHVFAGVPFGSVAYRSGPMMAGADFFEMQVSGRSAHGASPHAGVNPITAASQVVGALPTIVASDFPPGTRLAVSVTRFEAGHAANVIPDRATLAGSVRGYDALDRDRALVRLAQLGARVCDAFGAGFTLSTTARVPSMANAESLLAAVDAAVAASGARHEDSGLRNASEDFALIGERVPAFFFGVGAGGPNAAAHHSPSFDVDEGCIGLTSQLLTRIAVGFLPSV